MAAQERNGQQRKKVRHSHNSLRNILTGAGHQPDRDHPGASCACLHALLFRSFVLIPISINPRVLARTNSALSGGNMSPAAHRLSVSLSPSISSPNSANTTTCRGKPKLDNGFQTYCFLVFENRVGMATVLSRNSRSVGGSRGCWM